MESRLHFSTAEKRQDMILGIAFLFITAFSSVRIVRNCSPTGGRKVITTFNILIFIASAARALWFLLPNNILETSYTPEPLVAFVDNGWKGALISEILLVVGSLSLYGIFILVACYWVNMLRKLNSNTGTTDVSTFARFKVQRLGTLETFTIIMSLFAACQALNIVLYLSQVFNSEQMILYDSILLTVVSVAVVAEITILSNQIQVVLQNLEAINNRNSQPQIRRIFAIIVVANMFFVTRVILECTLAVCLIQLMKGTYYNLLMCIFSSCRVSQIFVWCRIQVFNDTITELCDACVYSLCIISNGLIFLHVCCSLWYRKAQFCGDDVG